MIINSKKRNGLILKLFFLIKKLLESLNTIYDTTIIPIIPDKELYTKINIDLHVPLQDVLYYFY